MYRLSAEKGDGVVDLLAKLSHVLSGGDARRDQVSMPVTWPTSIRWPSGSRTYARISRPWSFGSVRNSAPFADHSAYAAWISATRTLRKAVVRSGSAGVASVTVGLSSVGP